MPSSVAEKQMNLTLRLIAAIADFVARAMEADAKKQINRDKYAGIRNLGKAIGEGRGTVYTIQGNGLEAAVKQRLDEKGIFYLPSGNGDSGILIDRADRDAVAAVNRECLIAKSNYYQVVGKDEMEDAIARSPKIKDKGILEIKGLSFYEMECLKHKCNDISKGFTVGVQQQENGTYNMVVRTGKVYEYDPERTDFCEAAARYAMSLYGPNFQVKVQQIQDDARTDVLIAGLKDDDKEHWLMSANRSDRYVHFIPERDENGNITKHRFEYVELSKHIGKNGRPIWTPEVKNERDSNDQDYEVELLRATDRINDKVIIDDPVVFGEMMTSPEKVVDTDRKQKTFEQARTAEGERIIADKINVMIKNSGLIDMSKLTPQQAFEKYRAEFAMILTAAKERKFLDGYDKKDVVDITHTAIEHNMDLGAYEEAMDRWNAMNIDEREAKRQRVKTVEASKEETDRQIRKENISEKRRSRDDEERE